MNRPHLTVLTAFGSLILHAAAVPEILPPLELPVPPATVRQSRSIAYGVYMEGAKIGCAPDTRAPQNIGGRDCYIATMEAHITLKAMDNLIKIDIVKRASLCYLDPA